MPELAEVEYYRKQWTPAMGQIVEAVQLNAGKRVFRESDTQGLVNCLPGNALVYSCAHGKQMCFRFGARYWLGVHLGMTGRTRIAEAADALGAHDHLVLQMADRRRLVFSDARMFGRILYSNTVTEPAWWASRPPDLLSEAFTTDTMDAFLDRRANSPIKAVLLMQEAFPGIGNWMADEILWRSRIRPTTRCRSIGPGKRKDLYVRVREVCADALRVIGTDWNRPPDDWLFNHRWRNGGRCPRTGKPLRRETVGGRTTCWSPSWQR